MTNLQRMGTSHSFGLPEIQKHTLYWMHIQWMLFSKTYYNINVN